MKKNRFIKLASGLLVLCLMTTCVIGATLAKYTTATDTQDSARVAKWGVRITAATNSAFATEYNKSSSSTGLSVQSSASNKVVAPGTSGSAVQFTISGTPEVAVKLSFNLKVITEVKLTAGTYKNTDGATVTLAGDYMPVVFTLNNGTSDVATGTLGQIANYLNSLTLDYVPGTDLSTNVPTYTLSWAWTFDVSTDADKADTLLGDLAAEVTGIQKSTDGGTTYNSIATSDYSTNVSYTLTITATQID